jgi:hypothetical protein
MNRINITDENGLRTSNWFNKDSAESFDEAKVWNGSNHISKVTGSQFEHERLYITPKKRFVLNTWSNFQGTADTYTIIDKDDAVEWLIRNEYYTEVEEAFAGLLETYEV